MEERGEGQKFLNKKSLPLEHICNQIDRTTNISKLLKSFFEKAGSESYFRTMKKMSLLRMESGKLSFSKDKNSRKDSIVPSPRYACKLQVIYIQSYTRFKAGLTCTKHHVRNF